jgi:hypothetical protein
VNQAERLVWEADTVDQLDADFCRQFLETESDAELPALIETSAAQVASETHEQGVDRPLVPTPADVFAGRRAAPPPGTPPPGTRLGPDRPAMEDIGARIAARWLLTRGRENVADLLPGPVLPTVIDKELLVEAEEEISRSLRPYEDARRALRDGFWARLHREFGLDPDPGEKPAAPPPAATPALGDTPAGSGASGSATAGPGSAPAPTGPAHHLPPSAVPEPPPGPPGPPGPPAPPPPAGHAAAS